MSEGGSVFRVIREEDEAFGETYTGPKHEKTFIRFDESANNKIFETANGMTRKEVQEKNEADVEALFRESEKENIGGVFEKGNKIEEKALPNNNAKSMVDAGGVFEKQDKLDGQPRFSEKANKGSGNINWGDFYDESDTMDSKKPHLSRQTTKPEDLKFYYHDTKDTVTEVKGLDRKEINEPKERLETPAQKIKEPSMDSSFGIDLDVIKKIEKEGVKKEKEMNHDDMGMSGPSRTSSMSFL